MHVYNDTMYLTEVKGALLLDVIVGKRAAVLELLASKDQALLVRRDTLLVLNLRLDVVDGIRGFDLKGNGLSDSRISIASGRIPKGDAPCP